MWLGMIHGAGRKRLIPAGCSTDGVYHTGTCSDTIDGDDETLISVNVGSGDPRGYFEVILDLGSVKNIMSVRIKASYTKGADAARNGRILAEVASVTKATWDFTSTISLTEFSADILESNRYITFRSSYYPPASGPADAGIVRLAEVILFGK